jgi:tRNA uridine 5-carbamoylmethylation protein Kti12
MRRNITLLCGLPCSGKSTYIQRKGYVVRGYTVISFDRALAEVRGTNQPKTWIGQKIMELYRSILISLKFPINSNIPHDIGKLAEKKRNIQFAQAVQNKVDILYDQTLMSASIRKKAMAQCQYSKKRDYLTCVYFVPTTQEILDERNIKRYIKTGVFIPQRAFHEMRSRFEEPTFEEGFDCIIYVQADGTETYKYAK